MVRNVAKSKTCPEHKVHENVMQNSSKEKYLGEFITEKANSKDTIEDRSQEAMQYYPR